MEEKEGQENIQRRRKDRRIYRGEGRIGEYIEEKEGLDNIQRRRKDRRIYRGEGRIGEYIQEKEGQENMQRRRKNMRIYGIYGIYLFKVSQWGRGSRGRETVREFSDFQLNIGASSVLLSCQRNPENPNLAHKIDRFDPYIIFQNISRFKRIYESRAPPPFLYTPPLSHPLP